MSIDRGPGVIVEENVTGRRWFPRLSRRYSNDTTFRECEVIDVTSKKMRAEMRSPGY